MNLSFDTFKEQLARDKKKATMLGVLSLVLIVVVARLFVSKSMPETAEALVPITPATVPAAPDPLIRPSVEPITPNTATTASTSPTPPAAPRPRRTGLKMVDVSDLPRSFDRDPFTTPDWNRFKPDEATLAASNEKNKAQNSEAEDAIEQLKRQFAAMQEERKRESAEFQQALSQLELHSTLTGLTRSAFISGRLVHEGDVVNGFTVVQIRDREVIVKMDGMTGTIQMR